MIKKNNNLLFKTFSIYTLMFLTNCGLTYYRSIPTIETHQDHKIYNNKEDTFEITFACDQWFYNPEANDYTKLHPDDCGRLLDNKIKIIGEDKKTFVGTITDDLFLFSSIESVKKRQFSDQTIYRYCKNIIYTYTSSSNYKNANKFLRSTQFPEDFTNSCFELHTNLHFMKLESKINELDYIFNIRSSQVFISFHNEYRKEENNRFILKVIGWKNHLEINGIQKYPHYLAFQIE
ncbi:hypothetical protein CH381_31545 [Leptospira sp. mixed culture ATI2-C-A1]|nr:hypothetical protein CH381_31545 [Leptospira sp. mixed culture ATI2-C-A1]